MNKNVAVGLIVAGVILGVLGLLQHTVGLLHVLHLAVYLGVLGVVALVAGLAMFFMGQRQAA